MLSKDTNNV